MKNKEYLEQELHKMHFDFVGDKFNDQFKYKVTDESGVVYEGVIKALSFKHAAMYLQKKYHSVLKLESI